MKENLTSKTGHFHFAKTGHYHVAGTFSKKGSKLLILKEAGNKRCLVCYQYS